MSPKKKSKIKSTESKQLDEFIDTGHRPTHQKLNGGGNNNFSEKVSFIWNIADLLRGTYKRSDYGKIILPFTVLRRLDQILEDTRKDVLSAHKRYKGRLKSVALDKKLQMVSGHSFYNTSSFNFETLLGDQDNLSVNLINYIDGFSPNARDIMYKFDIKDHIAKLEEKNLLYVVFKEFSNPQKIDLHPDKVSNIEMGYIFEELIRKFSEQSNETAGEHFTPREVIKLMVNLLFVADMEKLRKEGVVRTLYDPACGTGGMLSVAEEYLLRLNPNLQLVLYGQELNDEAFAICKSDMLIKGHNPENIASGNSFSQDRFSDRNFDYMLTNPPFGVDWRNVEDIVKNEHKELGFSGRFGAGTPRINDGSLLFLQHMLSKMKDNEQGSRLAIVFNGSPLFTGGAGSNESEIRKWIIEHDWLEAVIALPDQLFYNTGIFTYIWILSNNKLSERKGKVQLINAIGYYQKMRRSLGNKRNYIHDEQIDEITKIYQQFKRSNVSKILDNEDFGYYEITIEQPLRDSAPIVTKSNDKPIPDKDLRDTERVPLKEDINDYFKREVKPFVEDAWINKSKTRIGYEIPLTRYFYEFEESRSLEEIDTEIRKEEEEIVSLLNEL